MANVPIDWQGALDTFPDIFDAIIGKTDQVGVPRFLAVPVAALIGLTLTIVALVVVGLIKAVVKLGTIFAVDVLSLITKVRTENAADFNQVIAAALSELMGVEISPDQLSSGQGPQGLNDRVASIGRALHDLLRNEFLSGGPITPEQGKTNAEKFSGFAINFATGSAFVSILTEAVSIGFLKQFRELGVETAQALGLGRLQRLAMQPLIRNAIQQPYDLYYRNLLRPDRLSEGQVINALRAGDLTDDQARQQLAEKGYRDSDIDILIDQLALKVQPAEIERLIRHSVITEQQGIDKLKTQGMTEEDARNYLKSLDAARADSHLSSMLNDLESARLNGFIDQNQLVGLVQDLPMGPLETEMFMRRVGRQLEVPRREVTFAQLQKGVLESVVDFSFVDQWLRNKGYSEEENTILTYEIISALATAEAKAAAKAAKCKQLQAAGKPCPP